MAEEAFDKGNQEFVKENWKAALEHFSKAAELDSAKAEYHLHKAAALLKLNLFEEAKVCCDTTISLDPGNSKAFLRKGMILVQQGKFELARQTLTAGQQLDPSNKSFCTWLAKCGSEDPKEAPNTQLKLCDDVLGRLFESHGNQGYPLIETVFEFLSRKSEFFKNASVAHDLTSTLVRRYAEVSSSGIGSTTSTIVASTASTGLASLRTLPLGMSATAKSALEKARADREVALSKDGGGPGTAGIKPGTPCKLNGCPMVYQDEASLKEECMHHPGAPVFHEGYKYWSCCPRKKSTDFTEFLTFGGCTRSLCIFEDDPTKKKKALCRYDFFQQGPTVTVSIYARKVDPEQSVVRVSPTRLSLTLLFDFVNTFTLDVALSGRVDPEGCKVEILAPKVEITLRKADGTAWTELGVLETEGDMAD